MIDCLAFLIACAVIWALFEHGKYMSERDK